MAKRKFSLEAVERPEESGGEIERLFDSELRAAERPVLRDLPIDRIQPNPFQARQNFDHLDDLVNSIRSQGFVSRLRVRPHPESPDQFQLVYGERRLRAAAEAGLRVVPVEIAPHSDEQLIEIGLAENIQRQDLDPLEEAYAFRTLITQRGYTQQGLADRIGKDFSYVTGRLHILDNTPADVQEMVRQRADTLRSAREIAKLPDAETRAPLIAEVLDRRLSTRAVRERVRELLEALAQRSMVARTELSSGHAKPPVHTSQNTRPVDLEDRTLTGDQAGRNGNQTATNSSESTLRKDNKAYGMTLDRDIRNVRAIFQRWLRHVETLDEPYLSRLIEFMTAEHLQQVDHLIQALERKH